MNTKTKTTVNTIYAEMRKAGVKIDNHCSDMYVPVNETTTKIISNYEFKQNVTKFICEVEKTLHYDIPFAFDPFFGAALKGGK